MKSNFRLKKRLPAPVGLLPFLFGLMLFAVIVGRFDVLWRYTRTTDLRGGRNPSNSFALTSACKNVSESLLPQLYVRRTSTSHPFYISTHSDEYDHMRYQIFQKGYYYEKWLTALVDELIPVDSSQRGFMIDVGANIGWFGLHAASHGEHIQVIAVEPNPLNIARLCQSVWINRFQNVDVNFAGIGSSDAETKQDHAYFHEFTRQPGQSYITLKRESSSDQIVPLRTLDAITQLHGIQKRQLPVYLLKIDVEGFELQVIKGATELLKSGNVKTIVMEFQHREQAGWHGGKELYTILIALDYLPVRYYWWGVHLKVGMDQIGQVSNDFDVFLKYCREQNDKHCNVFWQHKNHVNIATDLPEQTGRFDNWKRK